VRVDEAPSVLVEGTAVDADRRALFEPAIILAAPSLFSGSSTSSRRAAAQAAAEAAARRAAARASVPPCGVVGGSSELLPFPVLAAAFAPRLPPAIDVRIVVYAMVMIEMGR